MTRLTYAMRGVAWHSVLGQNLPLSPARSLPPERERGRWAKGEEVWEEEFLKPQGVLALDRAPGAAVSPGPTLGALALGK